MNRVTAGIPSLSPDKRGRIDGRIASRARQLALLSDKEEKKQAAIAKDAGRDVTKKAEQQGIVLQGHVICHRLKKLNPSLWFELSKADQTKMGVYYRDPKTSEVRFLGGFERDLNPEFETVITDEQGEAQRTIRGWRTILKRLIQQRMISEPGAFMMFGPPSRQSERWFHAIA